MKKRQKSTLNAELIALLASIRNQIDDTFDDYDVETGDDDGDSSDDDCDDED